MRYSHISTKTSKSGPVDFRKKIVRGIFGILTQWEESFFPKTSVAIVILFWLKWARYLAVAGLNLLPLLSDGLSPFGVLNCSWSHAKGGSKLAYSEPKICPAKFKLWYNWNMRHISRISESYNDLNLPGHNFYKYLKYVNLLPPISTDFAKCRASTSSPEKALF